MKLPRRQFLHLAAGAAALPALSRIARAQTYPTRPVRMVVGFPPGGSADIVARLMGQWLSERLGQPFIIENRPGAGSNIGTEAVVRAPPDGYTLLLGRDAANAINATLYEKLNFNFIRDIAPVASITPHAQRHGGQSVGSGQDRSRVHRLCQGQSGQDQHGIGRHRNSTHMAGELFKMMTGVDMVHVPYRGVAPALTDLLGGQVQVMFDSHGRVDRAHQGRQAARAGGDDATRSEALPDVPTVGEFVPGYEASAWSGIGAPKDTPAEIIDKLNKEINAGLADPKDQGAACRLGRHGAAGSPADFGKLIAEKPRSGAR